MDGGTCDALDGIGGLGEKMAGDSRVPGGKDGVDTLDACLHDVRRSHPGGAHILGGRSVSPDRRAAHDGFEDLGPLTVARLDDRHPAEASLEPTRRLWRHGQDPSDRCVLAAAAIERREVLLHLAVGVAHLARHVALGMMEWSGPTVQHVRRVA